MSREMSELTPDYKHLGTRLLSPLADELQRTPNVADLECRAFRHTKRKTVCRQRGKKVTKKVYAFFDGEEPVAFAFVSGSTAWMFDHRDGFEEREYVRGGLDTTAFEAMKERVAEIA